MTEQCSGTRQMQEQTSQQREFMREKFELGNFQPV